jgi:hypothetical protein
VRLDEWQKFIEAQFLDEEPAPPPAEPAIEAVTESVVEAVAESSSPDDSPPGPAEPDRGSDDALTAVVGETGAADEDAGTGEDAGVRAVRRSPKFRARHAHNVRPEPVPSGLGASVLWVRVPQYVETLIALERLEEDQEVAQYSYKRAFTENRQELIERLLNPVLSLEETARLLNVCPATVRRYTNRGILTYYRKERERSDDAPDSERETRQRRFRLSDILAFLDAQQTSVDADRESERRGVTRGRRAGTARNGSVGSAAVSTEGTGPEDE